MFGIKHRQRLSRQMKELKEQQNTLYGVNKRIQQSVATMDWKADWIRERLVKMSAPNNSMISMQEQIERLSMENSMLRLKLGNISKEASRE